MEEIFLEGEIVKKDVVYSRPSLFRRVMASLIDILLLALLTFSFLLGARAIVDKTPNHKMNLETATHMRIESGLYKNHLDKEITIRTYIENYAEANTDNRKMTLARAYIEGKHDEKDNINGFLSFSRSEEYGSEELYQAIKKQYDDYRLNTKYTFLGNPYFIRGEVSEEHPMGEIIVNPSCTASNEKYYEVYISFLEGYCNNVLLSAFPKYIEAIRNLAITLFVIELPICFLVSGILVYLVPTLIFKRGHKTIGKLAYKIGVVDKNCLNISNKTNIFRFLIFYFSILVLSIFTFAIPVFISFTMMAFSKNKQSFPDYMLGLQEVDTSGYKIYYSMEEAKIDQFDLSKKPVDFKNIDKAK